MPLAAERRAVLVSSHLLSEMQQTADRLVVIGRGRMIGEYSMDEFLAGGHRVMVETVDTRSGTMLSTVLGEAGYEAGYTVDDGDHGDYGDHGDHGDRGDQGTSGRRLRVSRSPTGPPRARCAGW